MPHIIIECSENLRTQLSTANVCEKSYEALLQTGLFKPDDIKTRLYSAADFHVGLQGKEGSFAHALIQIMEGRTMLQKQDVARAVFAVLKQIVPLAHSVTVNVQELNKDLYQKA